MSSIVLFKNLSSPNKTSVFSSFAGTIVLWILFFLCLMLIKPAEKQKKYKEVQIVLDANPKKQEVQEKTSESSMAASDVSQSAENQTELSNDTASSDANPVPPTVATEDYVSSPAEPEPAQKLETIKPVENAQKTKSEAKPESKSEVKAKPEKEVVKSAENTSVKKEQKSEPVKETVKETIKEPVKESPKAVPVEPVYAKSVDDALDFNTPKKSASKQSFNWDAFDEDSDEAAVENKTVTKKVQTENTMSGTAATGSSSTNTPVTSKRSGQDDGKTSVSSGTMKNLDSIGKTSYAGTSITAADGSEAGADDFVYDGKSFRGSNGRTRGLLTPAVINIQEHADQITGSETVEIKFVVLSIGSIDKASIEISPPVLTRAVKDEIISQLMTWKFSPDDKDAVAVFSLNIVKK